MVEGVNWIVSRPISSAQVTRPSASFGVIRFSPRLIKVEMTRLNSSLLRSTWRPSPKLKLFICPVVFSSLLT